jgi:hypothetical protein
MFGLESHEKEKGKENKKPIFELEHELLDGKKHREIKDRIEKRIREIQMILREGEKKIDFERFALILNGYTSVLKVISRFTPKSR